MVYFPAPVGGTPSSTDFAPSIVFAVLYGCLVPLEVYRFWHRRSRTVLLIGTAAFAIERIVIFSLRAVQSHNEQRRNSNGLIDYMQISFALGSIGIANDLVNIVRCLLVNPTYGPERFPESAAAATKECMMKPPIEGVTKDMPRERFWIRRFCDFYGLAFLSSTVPGIIANSHFHNAFKTQSDADNIWKLRIVSSSVCIFLTIGLLASILWGKRHLDRISMRGVAVITVVVSLVNVIAIYRLAVMPIRENSLTDPNKVNSSGGKAAFYVLHVLPEWLASVTLFAVNVRKSFGTGLFGDWRGHDETEKEKAKRLKRLEKKAAKKAAKAKGTESQLHNSVDDAVVEKKGESSQLVTDAGLSEKRS